MVDVQERKARTPNFYKQADQTDSKGSLQKEISIDIIVYTMFEMNFSKFVSTNTSSGAVYYYRDIEIPKDFYPNLPFLFRALLFRQKINMNTFVLAVGNPRTGKSYFAMKLAEIYSEKNGNDFNIRDQLTFDDIRKFLVWSKDAKDSIFILDETGTTLSGELFWSLQQRIMRRFVQTQGFRKNVLIWVLPSIVFLQKGFRFMSNYAVKTIKQGLVEVYKIKVDQLLGKGYPERIETINFAPPDKKISREYEKMKKEWNDETLEDDIEFIDQIDRANKYIPQVKGSSSWVIDYEVI